MLLCLNNNYIAKFLKKIKIKVATYFNLSKSKCYYIQMMLIKTVYSGYMFSYNIEQLKLFKYKENVVKNSIYDNKYVIKTI